MLIIFDKKTKEFIRFNGTNSMFPDGNFGVDTLNLRKNEDFVKIHDDSEFAKIILSGLHAN